MGARIYIKELGIMPNNFSLFGENESIVKKVLRLKKGDEIEIVDGLGTVATAAIEKAGKNACQVKIIRKSTYSHPFSNKITVIQAYPKGQRIDIVVQKMVELGADKLIFFHAKRSVPQFNKKNRESKMARMNKIAIEALRQSKRLFAMEIVHAESLKECLELSKDCDLKLLLFESGGKTIRKCLSHHDDPEAIVFAIGPEGSFTDDEVASFVNAGFDEARLGDEILRTETAPITVISILNYKYRWR